MWLLSNFAILYLKMYCLKELPQKTAEALEMVAIACMLLNGT